MTAPRAMDTSLAELVDLLRTHGEERWADRLERERRRLAAGDAGGADRLLALFGGMGSLNDLVIHPANGHRIAESEVGEVNRQLVGMLAAVAGQARALRRGADRARRSRG